MKTIIAGSRQIRDRNVLEEALRSCHFTPLITEVVSGCAPGVDQLGEKWAIEKGIRISRFPADWGLHGKAAGPIRNRQMAQYANALIAIPNPYGPSPGTQDMIRQAGKVGLAVYVHIVGNPLILQQVLSD